MIWPLHTIWSRLRPRPRIASVHAPHTTLRQDPRPSARAVVSWLDRLALSERVLVAGSEGRCPPPSRWPTDRLIRASWILYALASVAAYYRLTHPLSIGGMYRCGAENARRGGVPQSGHLFGADDPRQQNAGTRWAAVDVDLSESEADRVRRRAAAAPEVVRRVTGWPHGVGLIVYPSDRIHLDLRHAPSWVDVRT